MHSRAILGGIAFTVALAAFGVAVSTHQGPATALSLSTREDKVTDPKKTRPC